ECLRLPFSATAQVFSRKPAKLQKPCLVRMKCQLESPESFVKVRQEPFGLPTILESHNEVVRIADDDHVAFCLLLPPLMDPLVERVVEVDVGQERADTATLNRTHFPARPLPLFQHTGLQPFLD